MWSSGEIPYIPYDSKSTGRKLENVRPFRPCIFQRFWIYSDFRLFSNNKTDQLVSPVSDEALDRNVDYHTLVDPETWGLVGNVLLRLMLLWFVQRRHPATPTTS